MASDLRVPFGWARVAIGAAMALAPGLVGRLWWGETLPPSALVLLRGFGARDALIGAGTALSDPSAARGWVRAGIVADTADGVASALGHGLPGSKRGLTVAFATVGLVTGIVLDRSL